MPDPFAIVVCHDSGRPVVHVRGEVDLTNADTMTEALRALSDVGEHRVDLDLEEVAFMDSTGVRSLLDGLRFGLDLHVVATSERVHRVLDIAGVDTLLEVAAPSSTR